MAKLESTALDQIFRTARTHTKWLDQPVTDAELRELYDLIKFGPTSSNTCPARIFFLRTKESKERLKPFLSPGNVEKTMSAPVTAIIGYDLKFYDKLSKLSPHNDARSWFVGNEPLIQSTAFRNGSLQGAYFIIAARAVGLDCGPMSGFNNEKVDREFFAETEVKSNFLCNLGHGDASKLHPRNPRLDFEEVCKIL